MTRLLSFENKKLLKKATLPKLYQERYKEEGKKNNKKGPPCRCYIRINMMRRIRRKT